MHALGPLRDRFAASTGALWGLSAVLAAVLLPVVIKRVVMMPVWDPLAAFGAFAALLLVPLLLFAFCAPLLWLYRVRVHEQGLRAYDAWGRFHEVRWSAMSAAEPLHFPGMAWVRVKTDRIGVTITIPEFLSRQREFEALVRELAGPANPLSRHYATDPEKGTEGIDPDRSPPSPSCRVTPGTLPRAAPDPQASRDRSLAERTWNTGSTSWSTSSRWCCSSATSPPACSGSRTPSAAATRPCSRTRWTA